MKQTRTINSSARINDARFARTERRSVGAFATVDQSARVQIHSTTETLFDRAEAHSVGVWKVAFGPTPLIATGSQSGAIRIWDTTKPTASQPEDQLDGHSDTISGLVVMKDGSAIYSSGLDGRVLQWRSKLPARLPITRIQIATRTWDTAFTPAGDTFAAAGRGGIVELRNTKTGQLIRTLSSHRSTADRVRFSADGKFIATAGWKSDEIVIRRVADGDTLQTIKTGYKVRAVAFSPDSKAIVAACDQQQLMVFRLVDGKKLISTSADRLKLSDVAWSADGKHIVTSSGDWGKKVAGRVMLWAAASLTEVAVMEGHTTGIASVVFNSSGTRIASASKGSRIKIWDVATAREIANLGQSDGTTSQTSPRIRAIEFSPNGKFIAAAMYDGTVQLWDHETQTLVRRFADGKGADRASDMFSVHFSPDGSVLCGASGEDVVPFWDISDLTAGSTAKWIRRWNIAEGPKP